MTDQVQELLQQAATDLIANNASGIAHELAQSPDGTLSIGVSFKLVKMQSKISSKHSLSYARKFKDEDESCVDLPDPNQPELSVTIRNSNGDKMQVPKSVADAMVELAKK